MTAASRSRPNSTRLLPAASALALRGRPSVAVASTALSPREVVQGAVTRIVAILSEQLDTDRAPRADCLAHLEREDEGRDDAGQDEKTEQAYGRRSAFAATFRFENPPADMRFHLCVREVAASRIYRTARDGPP